MEKTIKIKCPAKINLDLRVYPKTKDGYHPIKSIMQAINLFDYITITLNDSKEIKLSGTSDEIPYDENNLCYKAAEMFLKAVKKNSGVDIYIEKNIPVAAGLAGGSTDCAGVLFGLNKLFNEPLDNNKLQKMAFNLGSDVPFCLVGGTKLCCGRGEKMTPMPFYDFKLSLIKPKNLKISAKEAYEAFDNLKKESDMRNDLEFALLDKYEELRYLDIKGFQMSGSGPTFFMREKNVDFEIDKEKYEVFNNLNSVNHGVCEI